MRLYCSIYILIYSLVLPLFVVNVAAQNTQQIKRDSAIVLLKKAFAFGEKYELTPSLDYAIKGLELAKEIENDTLIARGYNTLGVTYARLLEREKAYIYMQKASEIQLRIHDSIQLSRSLNNLGILHYYKKEYDQALALFERSLKIADVKKSIIVAADPLFNTGRVYLDIGDTETAIRFFSRSIITSKEIPERRRNLAYSYLLLGKAFYLEKKYQKAIDNLTVAVKISDGESFYDLSEQSYEIFYNIYNAQNKLRAANEALIQHMKYVKKSYDVEKATTVERLKLAYEIKEGEEKIETVEKEKKQQAKTIKYLQLLTLAIIFLVLSLLFIVYQLYKKKNELTLAKEQAEQASQIKANFFSIITHELRTPLYAVIGLTDLLLKEKPRNDQEEYLTSLKFSGSHLLALINNVLQINKIDADKVEVESISFDLDHLIHDIIDSLRKSIEDKGNTVTISIDENIPCRVKGDSLKISQILINLIGNAIKFTENGTIWVSANITAETTDTLSLLFSVKDEGIGVSKKKQKLIFEDFSQESMQVNRKYGGTGLGLAIVKKLLALMGSDIQIESEPGKGARFYFNLTLEKDFAVPEKVEEEAYTKLKNLKILIVDDNQINQLLTKKILEKKEVCCQITNNGFQAIKKIKEEYFDIVLMDIHMPEMDGYETTQKIREFNAEVPIIALTANTLEDTGEKIKQSGMNDYISKPFVTNEFYKKIIDTIQKSKLQE